jgi:hypothetical protein
LAVEAMAAQVMALVSAPAKPEFRAALSMAMATPAALAPAIRAQASLPPDQTRKMARPALPADCRRPTPADKH